MNKIKSLKITTLAENLVQAGGLGQWGLSLILELEDAKGNPKKVVFDTGMVKEAVLHNAKVIEENFSDVDCVVMSHGHLDHTATTTEIVEAAGGVKVYGHPHTFLPKFNVDKEEKDRSPGRGEDWGHRGSGGRCDSQRGPRGGGAGLLDDGGDRKENVRGDPPRR